MLLPATLTITVRLSSIGISCETPFAHIHLDSELHFQIVEATYIRNVGAGAPPRKNSSQEVHQHMFLKELYAHSPKPKHKPQFMWVAY